jgi:hypothetical protein
VTATTPGDTAKKPPTETTKPEHQP